MIVSVVGFLAALITATICIVMVVQDYSYGARRQAGELQASRARRGVDIEDLCILMGAEGWSEPTQQEGPVTGDWASDCADDRERRLIYLASPYSHPDPQVRQYRYEQVLEATRLLMLQGRHIWSPIVYTHQLAEAGMPMEWEFWAPFDRAMLSRCQELWVLALAGWRQSRGIQEEVRMARELGLRVYELAVPRLRDCGEAIDAPLRELAECIHPIGCVCAVCEREQVREAMRGD